MRNVTVAIRIPTDIKKGIQAVADRDLRSFNNQVTLILTKFIKQEKPTDEHN